MIQFHEFLNPSLIESFKSLPFYLPHIVTNRVDIPYEVLTREELVK